MPPLPEISRLWKAPMQHTAQVVVLIPAHNEEASIGVTVQALLRQERIPDRIVVIADNCTDQTVAAASALRHEALIITETRNNRDKKCGGLNAAWRRYGMDADIVVCLDADTVLPPNAIGDWIGEFAAEPDLAGSSSKFTMLGTALLVRLQRAEFAKWTDMPTIKALWGQRMKWQVGTVEDLLRFGVN